MRDGVAPFKARYEFERTGVKLAWPLLKGNCGYGPMFLAGLALGAWELVPPRQHVPPVVRILAPAGFVAGVRTSHSKVVELGPFRRSVERWGRKLGRRTSRQHWIIRANVFCFYEALFPIWDPLGRLPNEDFFVGFGYPFGWMDWPVIWSSVPPGEF